MQKPEETKEAEIFRQATVGFKWSGRRDVVNLVSPYILPNYISSVEVERNTIYITSLTLSK